ncbi:hybrid sensor histidine kinase/response regulator transcription factor [Mucilaginibacter sp. X5P1]|uniref:hybrid sensor histidine kinase/response regulator transcription factor n=1 Tax=Mucilaginibacter sp. X5P1 TaxID=2723088 RepID=UPI00161B4CC9|nr:two-component regulator propeller domain-containing protein [Mucilaginibacter sp. X5P1]MBB6137175.1 signal transduction histidine kinase/DNA-binding response OmpR family regulator/ligand-binding sensor domain-containing protein [Mucilaginibacter sp. X5P1]
MKIEHQFGLKKDYHIITFLFLILITCINPPTLFGQAYPYKFKYLTVDEGLSHTDANDIAQDKLGYIWVATYFGLDRYDGYTVNRYYNNNAPLNNAFKNRLRCIYADDNGNVWLSSEGGLQCFDVRSEKYIDFNDDQKAIPTFEKLYKAAGGFLYGLFGGQLKRYILKGNTVKEQQLYQPRDVQFYDMAPDNNGTLFLSGNKGLWMLDKNNKFKRIAVTGLSAQNISKLYFDKRNNLLMASHNTAFFTIKKTSATGTETRDVIKQFACADNNDIKDILEGSRSDYWINDGTNLLRLDNDFNLIQTINNHDVQHSLNSNSLSKMFIDRSECLWVCTFGGGVNYCDLNEKLFYTLQHNPEDPNSLAGNHIRSVLEDGENLWIGTTANGLNLYNLKTQKFNYYNTYNSPVKLKNNVITSLVFDSDRNLWIGNNAGIEILKPDRKTLWRPAGYDKFPTYVIETLVKDCYGNIWFGNHMDRFGVIWKDDKNCYHVKYYGEGYFILADKSNPQLFVSSTHGLKRLTIDNQGNIVKSITYQASSQPNSLSSNYTYPICKQNDSTFWIGTIGGGLDRLSLGINNAYKIKSYSSSYGIFNDVESLEIDNAGNIWMGGNGLECLNPATGKLIRYDKNDGLQGNSFKVGASYKGADGRLYFGGINGLNYFYPDQIKANNVAAKPILTDILVNNQKPVSGEPDSTKNSISPAISYSKHLTLNYLQNNFVIYFSSMHFANPLKCKYRYKLTGFDKDWRYTDGKNPSAAYSNLDYSNYRFIVQATNNDGIWSYISAEIGITITPPWWKSHTAKFIYVLLFLSALSGIYIYQARWYRLKREIEVNAVNEKKREEMHKQREELYQQQLMFFTNISHEFRTPLTLILGPLESLISENKNTVLDNSYQLMLRNAKRLTNLISELMNFKKVADSVIKLQVQPLIINQFCEDLVLEFQNLAISKNIDFKLINSIETNMSGQLTGTFDIQVLEKILFNLLNNSFKYTDVNGQVTFEVFFDFNNFKPSFDTGFQLLNENYRAKKYIYFRVADSGIGISGDSITRIFDRYYRISRNHLGSGVGLALVKSLTQLHKGDIYVYSERYKGTEIIIGIPWGEENYSKSEKTPSGAELEPLLEAIDNSILLPLPDHESTIQAISIKTNKHILIVDDNQELRVFLKQVFEKHYYIYEAEDGNKGFEIATEKVPDLIISDVMMPGMNGIEFCKLIKERFETRHIPFIILSAKDALDTKIEGMESGADYYFAKPLSIDLLLLTVHNIFEQGEILKQRYTNDYLSEATELVHSEKDKEFFNKLLKLIEDNIQDIDLDVDFLCKHLYISRTKLYQKIKSISDQSVGEFIRTIRLKKSIHIMTHEDIAMNEVADRVGLQSSSNFSRAFKKEYGKSPLQFMQALKKHSI